MKKIILTTLILISSIGLFAQPLPPPYTHGETTDQPGAPIDGGLSFLMLMGVAFGYKKINALKKMSTNKK
ncbi:MAG: PID-CTERM protein-sorting domain-containing protein [Bacteroidales bacterium]